MLFQSLILSSLTLSPRCHYRNPSFNDNLYIFKTRTASRKRVCFFSNFSYIQVTQKHKSKMKIQVAIARKILVAVWHMLKA